jgi:metal-responsive CopG/Arc/MetJ family transcriptional regulator
MVRINTVFDEELLRELDRIARLEHKSRSRLLREAAEKLVEERRRRQEEKKRRDRVSGAMEVQDRVREKAGDWAGTAELRRWRDKRR